ncbi:hypothetical protein DS878_10460 [Marinobacter sp. F3R11]|nr:hypothetical protein DS878_10460 [Marinobacter sp. F3R11]
MIAEQSAKEIAQKTDEAAEHQGQLHAGYERYSYNCGVGRCYSEIIVAGSMLRPWPVTSDRQYCVVV